MKPDNEITRFRRACLASLDADSLHRISIRASHGAQYRFNVVFEVGPGKRRLPPNLRRSRLPNQRITQTLKRIEQFLLDRGDLRADNFSDLAVLSKEHGQLANEAK
jgi:hypothetical protein